MRFISGKHMHRRTFIRSAGATLALPFLDAMVPAGRLWGTSANTLNAETTRLICIEEAHGLAGCNKEWGESQNLFAPSTAGRDFEIIDDSALVSLRDLSLIHI